MDIYLPSLQKKKCIYIPSRTAPATQQLNKSPFSVLWWVSQCQWYWQPKENTWLRDIPVALGEALQGTQSRSAALQRTQSRSARSIHHKLLERHLQEQNKKWCQGPSQRQCNCQKMVRRMRNNYNIVMPFWSEVWLIQPSVLPPCHFQSTLFCPTSPASLVFSHTDLTSFIFSGRDIFVSCTQLTYTNETLMYIGWRLF